MNIFHIILYKYVFSKVNFFFIRVLTHYLDSITLCSAAPPTTLWGGTRPRFEPGMGHLEAETLTTRPPYLLSSLLSLDL